MKRKSLSSNQANTKVTHKTWYEQTFNESDLLIWAPKCYKKLVIYILFTSQYVKNLFHMY